VADQQLNISQRAASLVRQPGRPGDDRPPARVGRAAVEVQPPVPLANQFTMLVAVIGPPRSDLTT
jgi:hypothetical protein